MKKILLLLAMMLMSSLASAHDIEVKNDDGVTIYYNWIKNNELEVTYRGEKSYTWKAYSGDIIVPETVEFKGNIYEVTAIGKAAFDECRLTSVIIPNSVTTIGGGAFDNCYYLSSITIPNSVTSIGAGAFSYCKSLTSVIIPNSVKDIGGRAFQWCNSLSSISIPDGVTKIGENAFYNTPWFNNQPDGLIYAGKVAYKYKGTMSDNTHIDIKEGTLGISPFAFSECSGLTSISIPNSILSIGREAFTGTAWFDNQPDGIIYLGKWACGYKGTMQENTQILLEDGTFGIASGVFEECSNLITISAPNSLSIIGESAFSGCSSLIFCTIPQNVTFIGDAAFSGCSSLTTISIPNNVTSINSSTFYHCSSLTSVIIPNSVTSIGDYAFAGCSSLTSLEIPNSVEAIGRLAFANCSDLTAINIPYGVVSIDERTFQDCKSLSSVTIPNSVKSIRHYAFNECENLKSVTIPNSIVSIGTYAFLNCSGLTTVTIPNSLTSIGDNVFWNCINIKTTLIPVTDFVDFCNNENNRIITNIGKSVKLIDNDGTEIKNFVIPNGVTSIGDYAFNNCSGLTSVIIPNDVIRIGQYAFNNCSSLTSVDIPNNTTTIGESAFENCKKMKTLELSDKLQIIKKATFKGCNSLESITIPASVEFIYQEAFANCNALERIKAKPDTPPFLYDNSFSNFSVPLEVPKGCKDEYQTAQGWRNFTNISESDKGIYKLIYLVDNKDYKLYKIEEGSPITPEPVPTKEGYIFSGWSEIPETMPAKDVTIEGSFIPDTTGLEGITADAEKAKAYFDMNGREIPVPQKGVNIVKYANGKTEKIVIK